MQGDALLLRSDSTHQAVQLRFSSEPFSAGASVSLPSEFAQHHVCAALIATGWVEENRGQLRMKTDHSCRYLAQVVAAMFDLFEQPDRPRPELIDVKSAVAEYYAVQESGLSLTWFDYAWMHVMLHEAIMSEARNLTNVWSEAPTATIDLALLRNHLIETIIARHSSASHEFVTGRMAASKSTRATTIGDEKAG